MNSWAADHEREEKKKQSEAMERADREHTRALSNLQSEHEEKCKRIKADQQAELNRIERQSRGRSAWVSRVVAGKLDCRRYCVGSFTWWF